MDKINLGTHDIERVRCTEGERRREGREVGWWGFWGGEVAVGWREFRDYENERERARRR